RWPRNAFSRSASSMSVKAIVTVPSGAEDSVRSGRDSLTASAISSTDLVRRNPSSSLAAGIELCQFTIFQSPCSRWSTQVKRYSTVPPAGASTSDRAAAHPTVPSLNARTSSIRRQGYPPPSSRICWIHTRAAVSPSSQTSSGSVPNRWNPWSRESRLLTASVSPSRSASKKRVTTRCSSSDGSTGGVSRLGEAAATARLAQNLNGESNLAMEHPETLGWDAYPRALPSMLYAVGRTPLVRLSRVGREGLSLLAKIEWYGPTGSTKDRIYRQMIERAEARGD